MASLELSENADNTITVRFGRYIETISRDGKSNMEIIDVVRWVGITTGVVLSEESIWEELQNLRRST